MTLQIDMSFALAATPEERLAELEKDLAWLFEQQDAGKMTAHDVSYEVTTCQDERLEIIKHQAEQRRRLRQTSRTVGNVP